MSLPQIRPTNSTTWANRHNTFVQPLNNLFDLINGKTADGFADYNAMTDAIGAFLGRAIAENQTVRAFGGGWSFSKVATTNGWMLNTRDAEYGFPDPQRTEFIAKLCKDAGQSSVCPVRQLHAGTEQLAKGK